MKRASGYIVMSRHPATRLIMKLHLVHHRFSLCRVHNGETRARSINNGCFSGKLSRALLLRSQGCGAHSGSSYGSPRYQTHRDEITVSLGLHHYILSWKHIQWRESEDAGNGDRITRGNQNPLPSSRRYFRRNYAARTPLRNKSAIASAG